MSELLEREFLAERRDIRSCRRCVPWPSSCTRFVRQVGMGSNEDPDDKRVV